MSNFVAECEQCGIIERGDFEDVGDAAEDHDQWHDVQIQRAATDGAGHVLVSRHSSANVYHYPDPEDPDAPRCDRATVKGATYRRRDLRTVGDQYTLCQYCDPDANAHAADNDGGELSRQLREMDLEEFDDEVATDGGHPPGPTGSAAPPDQDSQRTLRCGPDWQFLGDDVHKCDLCGQVFETLERLADHSCDSPGQLLTDGGPIEAETQRVMVDIETLGLEPGAAILSIGAVRFDAGYVGETFETSVDLSSCQAAGLTIDAGTLEWWLDQDDAARQVLTGDDPLPDALSAFSAFYGDADEVWANSPSFDCEFLEAAYDAVGRDEPWDYHEERCFRTLSSLSVAVDQHHDGVEHDALDDALHQARVAAATLERFPGGGRDA